MTFEDDLAAEGEPEAEFHVGIAARQPMKRVAAGALFHDPQGRIVMVEPIYKPTLEIPGGMCEKGEAPRDACRREVAEEIGLEINVGKLLVVDWQPGHGVWGEIVVFVFDGGMLSEQHIDAVELQPDELCGLHRLALRDIRGRVRPSMYRRLSEADRAKRNGETLYLQFGR
jgi:ADP-ribose pyrophosphatase YjhB (NUDIX family)